MNVVRIYRIVKRKVYQTLFPMRYLEKIGVNFNRGGVHIYGKVFWSTEPWLITLGNNVHITDGVKFITHDGGTLLFRDRVPDLEITKPITIGDNVYFGNNVVVLPGVTIGSNVIVGAGAVVTRNIPDNSVAVGIPARVIKTADEYLEKACKDSLHLGHLRGKEKDDALKQHFGYTGPSRGIYF